MSSTTERAMVARRRTPLNRSQIAGFWGAWTGWTLDGMDSFIYALVLTPALTELLPRSGFAATSANVGVAGSILFALFLVGWGLSFIWGPIADRFGRTKVLAATIFTFAIFTGLSAAAQNVWELASFRFIAGVGIGGEWALAGTYVAEAWPEDRRKMGAGYLQTGYYAGFFLAAALNYTVGVHFGWRAMFLTGAVPVVVAILILTRVQETEKFEKLEPDATVRVKPLREILGTRYRRRTWVAAALVTIAIVGLWAGAVYEPTAVIQLAQHAGFDKSGATKAASWANRLVVHRHDLGVSDRAGTRGARRAQKDARDLFCGDGGVDCRQLRLGVLSAQWSCAVHRVAVRARLLRRQLRALQPLVTRTVRDTCARNGLRILHVVRPFRRRGRELLARRCGAAHAYVGSARRPDGRRFRDRAFHHPDGARDARRSAPLIGV